jgi:hypothetical protein
MLRSAFAAPSRFKNLEFSRVLPLEGALAELARRQTRLWPQKIGLELF